VTLRQLTYFVRIVDAGNMTRAAEQLHVAQPALGMQIRQMEESLGAVLLTRHSRGVSPTPAGALLYAHACAILERVRQARDEVAACNADGHESVRLGLTPTLMLLIGAELAVEIRDRIPNLFASLAEDMSHVLVESLMRGDIDLALAYDVPDVPQLRRTPLLCEDLVLVALPDAHGGEPIPFTDALEETLVLPEPGDTVRDLVVRTAEERGMAPTIAYVVRSIPAIRSLILRGVASGILPYGSIEADIRAGKLQARRIVEPALQRTLYLAAHARRGASRHEVALAAVVRAALHRLGALLGPLVTFVEAAPQTFPERSANATVLDSARDRTA